MSILWAIDPIYCTRLIWTSMSDMKSQVENMHCYILCYLLRLPLPRITTSLLSKLYNKNPIGLKDKKIRHK